MGLSFQNKISSPKKPPANKPKEKKNYLGHLHPNSAALKWELIDGQARASSMTASSEPWGQHTDM